MPISKFSIDPIVTSQKMTFNYFELVSRSAQSPICGWRILASRVCPPFDANILFLFDSSKKTGDLARFSMSSVTKFCGLIRSTSGMAWQSHNIRVIQKAAELLKQAPNECGKSNLPNAAIAHSEQRSSKKTANDLLRKWTQSNYCCFNPQKERLRVSGGLSRFDGSWRCHRVSIGWWWLLGSIDSLTT